MTLISPLIFRWCHQMWYLRYSTDVLNLTNTNVFGCWHFAKWILTNFVFLFHKSVQLAGVMGRLDVKILDSLNNWQFKDFSLICPFFVPLLGWCCFCIIAILQFDLLLYCYEFLLVLRPECFSNGTMTVVLPKLESVPELNPSELSLRDPACKPYYSEDHIAYFHFALSTCGTSRKVQ